MVPVGSAERRAYTVNHKFYDLEYALYEQVTRYVKEQMGKADELDGQRRGSVGFALGVSADADARRPVELLAMALLGRAERA